MTPEGSYLLFAKPVYGGIQTWAAGSAFQYLTDLLKNARIMQE
jgi:hypothetical protein